MNSFCVHISMDVKIKQTQNKNILQNGPGF